MANEIKSVSLIAYPAGNSANSADSAVLVPKGYVDGILGLTSGWQAGTYADGALISYNGTIYRANGDKTSSDTIAPGNSGSGWVEVDLDSIIRSITAAGTAITADGSTIKNLNGTISAASGITAWSISNTYSAGALVVNSGNLYRASTSVSANTALTTVAKWGKYVVTGTDGKIDSSLLPNLSITKVTPIPTGTGKGGESDAATTNGKGRFGITTVEAGDIVVETYTPEGGSLTTDIYMYTSTTANEASTAGNWIKLEAGELSTRLSAAETSIEALQSGTVTSIKGDAENNPSLTGDIVLKNATSGTTSSGDVTSKYITIDSGDIDGTSGIVPLASYRSGATNATERGYWDSSVNINHDGHKHAATPAGVAAYVASQGFLSGIKTYANNTAYSVNDLVISGGILYRVSTAVTNTNTTAPASNISFSIVGPKADGTTIVVSGDTISAGVKVYKSSTPYNRAAVVGHNGVLYESVRSSNSGKTPGESGSEEYWRVVSTFGRYFGAWTSTQTYQQYDIVSDSAGLFYYSSSTSPNRNKPTSNSSYWTKLFSQTPGTYGLAKIGQVATIAYNSEAPTTTVFNIAHGLGTENIIIQVYNTTTKELVLVDTKIVDTNNVKVIFASALSSGDSYTARIYPVCESTATPIIATASSLT